MRQLIIAAMCLGGGLAFADNGDETETNVVQEVQIRLTTMEQIDVTAEKTPVVSKDDFDSEIESILGKAEALEVAETDDRVE